MIMMMGMGMMMTMITIYLHDSIIDGMNKNVITVPNEFQFLMYVHYVSSITDIIIYNMPIKTTQFEMRNGFDEKIYSHPD